MATIFRIYTLYKPLKTFFAIGSVLMFLGVALGARFLWYFFQGDRGGHTQSLILAAVFLITGFHTWLIALLADLIAVNRRLSEDLLIRMKRLESPETERKAKPQRERERHRDRERAEKPEKPQPPQPQPQRPVTPKPEAPAAAAKGEPATQWVWLIDEDKLQDRVATKPTPEIRPPIFDEEDEEEIEETPKPGENAGAGGGPRRRRRRRGGPRPHNDLPGNRGKHLAGNNDGE
jgi:type IV secretory pathway VirB10-like protein